MRIFLIIEDISERSGNENSLFFLHATTLSSRKQLSKCDGLALSVLEFDIESGPNEQTIIRNGDESISHYQVIIGRYLAQRA